MELSYVPEPRVDRLQELSCGHIYPSNM